ncbi:F0F1 ATP synthase subunit B family protein [Metamycoplasma equirhinis]|uniref:F0F1 ATP synthase subunit B family protein n=1 Tax=Metamycoplasma equirhinis TaxID=92402 RepID=UPI003593CCA3
MNNSINYDVSQELNKAFSGLTFNWPYFVFSLITLGIIVLIITFLVYKPLKKMIKKRQEFIQNNIDDSIKAKEDALKIREENDKKIMDANLQANNIINAAKSESEKIINNGSQQAKKKAEMIINQAQILINKKQEEFNKKQKKLIIESAINISEKILNREIKDSENIKMIKEVLNEEN